MPDIGSSPLSQGTFVHILHLIVPLRLIPATAENTKRHRTHASSLRLIPARTGSIRVTRQTEAPTPAHPRSRGEQHQKADVLRVCLRLIPTRVGNMTRHIRIRHLHEVHPRSRGEHTVRACKSAPTKGSSPLAQGISRLLGIGLWVVRLTPARAGNMPAGVFLVLRPSAHPRSRGEHESPSTWIRVSLRLIPARAGNISCSPNRRAARSAHPRSRGEHFEYSAPDDCDIGSSPLARGTYSELVRIKT